MTKTILSNRFDYRVYIYISRSKTFEFLIKSRYIFIFVALLVQAGQGYEIPG